MLSVCVPIYNEEESIPILYENIKNVLCKLNREWEIILINDGSIDSSAAIMDQLAEKDSRVKIIHSNSHYESNRLE